MERLLIFWSLQSNNSLTTARVNSPRSVHASQDTEETSRRSPKALGSSTAISQDTARGSGSEWIDVDSGPKVKKRRKTRRVTTPEVPSKASVVSRRSTSESEVGRFFPKLSQILESSEAKNEQQSRRRTGEPRYTKYDRREEVYPSHRKTYRSPYRNASQRKNESLMQINASLLSVISGLTTSTDRSSGSNSTITQQSYHQNRSHHPRVSRHSSASSFKPADNASAMASSNYKLPYLISEADDNDGSSMASSSSAASSQYTASDSGSSEAVETPSSRSTFPSPTQARRQNAAELRRKYDTRMTDEQDIHHPRSRSTSRHRSRAADVRVDHSSRSSSNEPLFMSSSDPSIHPATYGDHYVEEMHRSESAERAARSALQPYYHHDPGYASDQMIKPENDENIMHCPPAPDAPNIHQKTVAGYEMLALELSSSASTVQPMYRKFEYLNHRLLLHLQDELVELEDQLRTVDEIIAQNEPPGTHSPQSRRREQYYGLDIHRHRTGLLGRIFQKTEQYNKAMAAYSTMLKDCDLAKPEQIIRYQEWMAQHRPVHELEAIFLWKENDLVVPGLKAPDTSSPSLAFVLVNSLIMVAATMLIMAMIPTLLPRLAVLAITAACAATIIWTTGLVNMLHLRAWITCSLSYTVLMAVTACCIPSRN